MILYLATNTINGKQYIGITSRSLSSRIAQHLRAAGKALSPNSPFYAALRKYGRAAFRIEPIAWTDSWESLCSLERSAIALYATVAPSGYNLTLGGEGNVASDETRVRIANSKRGLLNPQFGKARPQPIKARISAALTGLKRDADFRGEISRRHRGSQNPHAKITEETVRAIREQRSSGRKGRAIAQDFGVSEQLVCLICKRTRWAHVV